MNIILIGGVKISYMEYLYTKLRNEYIQAHTVGDSSELY